MLVHQNIVRAGAALAATFTVVAASSAAHAYSLSQYNLVVFEDLDSNSEVEGSAFIGGDLNGNSSNYCIKCAVEEPFDGIGLKVVGDINGTTKQVNNGTDLEYGGSLNTTVNTNGGGSQSQNSDLSEEFEQLKTEFIDLSQQLAGLESNSTVALPGQQPGAVKFQSSGAEIAVFDVNIEDLFSSKTQQIELDLNDSETVIINVHGTSGSWTQGNMVGDWVNDDVQQKVIWNFHEAETLALNNALHGSLLATNAHVTNYNELEGNVVVKSMTQYGEVHLPAFSGTLPPTETQEVPEPSILLGAVTAFIAFFSCFDYSNSSE